MQDALRTWTPRDNYVKYPDFPTPCKFAQIGCISPKIKCVKVRKQLAPRPEIITPNKTANQWKYRTSGFYDNRSQFPGKSIALQHIFYLAQCSSSQDNHVIMEKDAKSKGKGKTQTKRVKGRKCSIEEQDVQGIDGQTKSLCCFQQGFFLCLTKWRVFFLL